MAYTFAELLGHERAKRLLRRGVRRGRVAHAYLFRGPDGVGKKRAALTLAAWLNCREPQPDDACGRCASCRKMAAHSHPDCTIVTPEEDKKTIGIDQIRDLQKALAFPANEGKVRVAVLLDVGRLLLSAAANSLLKTLEEPPPGVVLILTTPEDAPLLDTIVSRCQVIPFGSLADDEVARLCKEHLPVTAETATNLAQLARGSVGRAIALHTHKIAELGDRIRTAVEQGADGAPAAELSLLDLAREAADLEEHLPLLLDLLSLWLRERLLAAAGMATVDPAADSGHSGPVPRPAKPCSLSAIRRRLERIAAARAQLAANCNPRAVCESLFFALR